MNKATSSENRWMLAVSLAFLAFVYLGASSSGSPDLVATWLAGHFFREGQFGLIYPRDEGVFTMLIPTEWWSYLVAEGREGVYYPYLYPPLWAWAASWVGPQAGIDEFADAFALLNPALLVGTSFLAMRTCGVRGALKPIWLAVGLASMLLTSIGLVAIEQNQPQILVSFLVVAAIERDRSGAWKTAGVLLAFAASIKLYPALIAILWLGERRWRSLAGFCAVGALLGILSIAVAGWPLHEEFLALVALLRETAVVTSFNYGIDSTLAQLFWREELIFVASRDNPVGADQLYGWKVLPKGDVWTFASGLVLLGVTAFLTRQAWRSGGQLQILNFPAFLAVVALLAPLSWGYHSISTLAFAPALLVALGPVRGFVLLAALLLPASQIVFSQFLEPIEGLLANQLLGTVAVAALGLALWVVRHRV